MSQVDLPQLALRLGQTFALLQQLVSPARDHWRLLQKLDTPRTGVIAIDAQPHTQCSVQSLIAIES